MTITLKPEQAEIVRRRLGNGEFETAEDVVGFALSQLRPPPDGARREDPTPEQAIQALEELWGMVERDPPSQASALSDEALTREVMYDHEDRHLA